MERKKFMNKVSCEFAVITHDLDCQIVTKKLCIEPDRYFNKGDNFTSKYSSRADSYPYGLWAIGSQPVISEELNVSNHVKYFQELLEGKIEVIEGFKKNYQFECVFSVAIETEDTGTRFYLNGLELSFIAKISSRYGCTFIAKESIEAQSSD
jgi:hypothetical protein